MKIKPKKIKVNLPNVIGFDGFDEGSDFVKTINSIMHDNEKVKCEYLGDLNGKFVFIFYLKRDDESEKIQLRRDKEYQKMRDISVEIINKDDVNYG